MGKRLLLIVFAVISLVLCLRMYADNAHYTTPDSAFYLRAADNLKEGKGYLAPRQYPFAENSPEVYLTIWPAGYPLLIAGVSLLTHTSGLVASKLVNLVFLGLVFLLLYKWWGNYAWFPALYFCSYSMLEIYSHTWSEGVFLFFLLYLVYILSHINERKLLVLELCLCLTALFLLRYVGLIYFFFTFLFCLYHLYRRNYKLFRLILVSLGLSGIVVLLYLYLNYQYTGSFVAGERFEDLRETGSLFFAELFQGIINELSIARNYYFTGRIESLYLVLLIVQLVVCWNIFQERSKLKIAVLSHYSPFAILLYAGCFYLVWIVLMARFIAFDAFDYRILAPFSMPMYVGIMARITHLQNREFFCKTYGWIVAFMILSLLVNLPKHFLLQYFSS